MFFSKTIHSSKIIYTTEKKLRGIDSDEKRILGKETSKTNLHTIENGGHITSFVPNAQT